MHKRQSLDAKGVDALFGKPERRETEQPEREEQPPRRKPGGPARRNTRLPASQKTEIAARLDFDTIACLDELRMILCRDYGIGRAKASQSAIIGALIRLYAGRIDEIAQEIEQQTPGPAGGLA